MSNINLQPTDRCVVKKLGTISETNTVTRTITARKISSFTGLDGVTNVLYEGTGNFTTAHPIKSVTLAEKQLAGGPSYTVTVTGEKSYQISVSVQYTFNNGASVSLNCSVKEETEYVGEVEKEVFQIKDNKNNYLWFKKKPVTINFDTTMIDSVDLDENLITVGGTAHISIPRTQYLPAGGWIHFYSPIPKDGYRITSGDIAEIDLSDVTNLTLEDFDPLTINITAEPVLEKPVVKHTLLMPTSSTITLYNPNSVAVTYSGTTSLTYSTSNSTLATWSGTLAAGATTTKAVTFTGASGSHTLGTTITFTSGTATISNNISDLIVMPSSISAPVIYLYKVGEGQGASIYADITNTNDYAVTISGTRSDYIINREDGTETKYWSEDYSQIIDANSTTTIQVSGSQFWDTHYYGLTATASRGTATSAQAYDSIYGGSSITTLAEPEIIYGNASTSECTIEIKNNNSSRVSVSGKTFLADSFIVETLHTWDETIEANASISKSFQYSDPALTGYTIESHITFTSGSMTSLATSTITIPYTPPPFPATYALSSLNETIVTLPTGQELSIYPVDPNDASDNAAKVSFSSDFDLVVAADSDQWGTYEIWGEYLLRCPVYIYDHNGYEHGNLLDSELGANPWARLRTHYTPIAVLRFIGEYDQLGDWCPVSVTVEEFRDYAD